MNKTKTILNKLEIVGFLVYFLVLTVERILALALSPTVHEGMYAFTNNGFYPIFVYVITALSIVFGYLILANPIAGMLKSLFKKDNIYEFDYKKVVVGSMVLLVSGMMHTSWTLAPVQFVAYGFLILSMVVKCINEIKFNEADKMESIFSLIYLVLYSMTIPVAYNCSKLTEALTITYQVAQFVTIAVLIPAFGCMLKIYFEKKATTSFSCVFPLLMIILDALVIALKWKEEINFFVLIFAIATAVAFIVFKIILTVRKSKK